LFLPNFRIVGESRRLGIFDFLDCLLGVASPFLLPLINNPYSQGPLSRFLYILAPLVMEGHFMANVSSLLGALRRRREPLSPVRAPESYRFHVHLGATPRATRTIAESRIAISAPTPRRALRQFLEKARTTPLKQLVHGTVEPGARPVFVAVRQGGRMAPSVLRWFAKGTPERYKARMRFLEARVKAKR
jgi:hypothetical protein